MTKASESFVENKGQWNSRAKFLSRTPNMNMWVTDGGLVLDYFKLQDLPNGKTQQTGHVIDMQFVGGNRSAKASGVKQARLLSSYYGPNADFKHAKSAHSFQEAKITSLYPGVDMRVYTENDRPRYDLNVAPGANPSQIKVVFKGAKNLSIGKDGTLEVPTKLGKVEHQGLYAYQMVGGQKQKVDAQFVLLNDNTVGYKLGRFDRSKKLVIDPVVYGSYYGGANGMDELRAVVADADGGIYMTGSTRAPDFPMTHGPYGVVLSGASDAFITKLQGDAYAHDYAAIFGGTGNDTGKFIGVDPTANQIWIAGTTSSNNFPGLTGSSFDNTLTGATDVFLIRFDKDSSEVLLPTYSTLFGSSSGAAGEELKGFAVGGTSGDLFIAGETTAAGIPGAASFPAGSTNAGYIVRLNSTGTGLVYGRYVGGSAPVTMGFAGMWIGGLTGSSNNPTSRETGNALAVDRDENAIVSGTVIFNSVEDTTQPGSTAFPTTAGVFAGGRLLRFNDMFVVKADPTGATVFSTLVSGADLEFGSGVAADLNGNIYVTGITTSHDYPRTRGVFGEDFSEQRCVVTKINQDGSQIIYSTSLRTHVSSDGQIDKFPGGIAGVWPTGIAVDQRGIAFITGVILDGVRFPATPGDPNEPSSNTSNQCSIPVTPDAPRGTYTYRPTPDFPGSDAWLMVLDPTATSVIYATYIGGDFDDYAFAPYTDRVGDVWVSGYTDIVRSYVRISADGNTIHPYPTGGAGGIPGFITNLAFKNAGSAGAGTPPQSVTSYYGWLQTTNPFATPPPPSLVTTRGRDGYVIRFRIDAPIVQSVVLNPSVIPGGPNDNPTTSTATITLNTPATGAGVDVVLTLSNNSAASFDPQNPQPNLVLNIPAGQTTGTVTIYSREVTQNTQVDLKAEYLGSFQVARLTIVPWLQKLTLSPPSVVGGNNATGVITLSAPAPASGLDVTILTNDQSLVSFPGGTTVNIPAGQTFGSFVIQTNGVDSQTDVAVSASLLGVGITQTLTLKQASLQGITFTPNRVAGGTSSTGTLRLDGKPGPSGFFVNLTLDAGTPGYTLSTNVLNFGPNDTQKTFTLNTVPEPANTQRRVTATRPVQGAYTAQTVIGTLFIDANFLVNMTINPTSVPSGGTSTGTVTISNTAQTGGVVVNLSTSNSAIAQVPATVTIPGGSTSATFTVTTSAVATDTVVQIIANRGAQTISKPLTVRGVTFSLSANPTSVIGGAQNITGTVTLPQDAPVGGVTVTLSSNDGSVTVPGSVTVLAGQRTATFTMVTTAVTTTRNVTITGQTQPGTTATVTVQIRAVSILDVILDRTVVKGGVPSQYPHVTVTLDAPAPAGGATVTFTSSNPSILSVPTISIPAGQTTSAAITIPVSRVNRTIAVTITANYNGRQIARTITVLR